jgi:septal ring factor EnvC (AmiA/AmiB activator)
MTPEPQNVSAVDPEIKVSRPAKLPELRKINLAPTPAFSLLDAASASAPQAAPQAADALVTLPQPSSTWRWISLALLASSLAGGLLLVAKQHIIQRALDDSQLRLAQTQQAYFAQKNAQSVVTVNAAEAALKAHSSKLSELENALTLAQEKLIYTKDQAEARDAEMQKLVTFLKDEVKALEAEVTKLKQALKSNVSPPIEIKPAQ